MKPGDRVICRVTNCKPVEGYIVGIDPNTYRGDGSVLVRVKVTLNTLGRPYSRPQYRRFHEDFITVME